MKEHRCPEYIFRLFDRPNTKVAGRIAAITWLENQVVEIGDMVLMPDPDTGEVVSFSKGQIVS